MVGFWLGGPQAEGGWKGEGGELAKNIKGVVASGKVISRSNQEQDQVVNSK